MCDIKKKGEGALQQGKADARRTVKRRIVQRVDKARHPVIVVIGRSLARSFIVALTAGARLTGAKAGRL